MRVHLDRACPGFCARSGCSLTGGRTTPRVQGLAPSINQSATNLSGSLCTSSAGMGAGFTPPPLPLPLSIASLALEHRVHCVRLSLSSFVFRVGLCLFFLHAPPCPLRAPRLLLPSTPGKAPQDIDLRQIRHGGTQPGKTMSSPPPEPENLPKSFEIMEIKNIPKR